MNHNADGAQALPNACLVSPQVAHDLAVIAARSINLDDVLALPLLRGAQPVALPAPDGPRPGLPCCPPDDH